MNYDIIIVGGGMVGLTCACLLAQRTSLSIAVLEAKRQVPSAQRLSALALSSRDIFQDLQIWDELQQYASPFREIMVWDSGNNGEIKFDSREIAESALGYIIKNADIHSALENKANQSATIKIISPVNLIHLIEQDDGIELHAEDGRKFQAKLAIAADGINSWLRQQANMQIDVHAYQQFAMTATVKTALPHQEIARQIFLSTGPLAFLPLQDPHQSSIVWTLPDEIAKQKMLLNDDEFQNILSESFEYRLGDVIHVGQRYLFPLSRQKAKNYIKPHLALIGDAAHTVHPLAGQGLNMGLLDAAKLSDIIHEAIKHQRDFSTHANLRKYERCRKAENFPMMTGIDFIRILFASDKNSVQKLRSLGLNSINRMSWLKNIFTRRAVRQGS